MAKTIIGTVSSDKVDKTIVITVTSRKQHPVYKKSYSQSKKFMAHDPKNEAKIGDKVSIEETRPISAHKHHVLKEILERPVLVEKKGEADTAVAKEEVNEGDK